MLKKGGIKYCPIPLLYYKTIEELKEQPEQEEFLTLWCLSAVNKILTKVFSRGEECDSKRDLEEAAVFNEILFGWWKLGVLEGTRSAQKICLNRRRFTQWVWEVPVQGVPPLCHEHLFYPCASFKPFSQVHSKSAAVEVFATRCLAHFFSLSG